MPNGARGDGRFGVSGRETNDFEIADRLSINVNLTVRVLQEALDLFDEAAFRSMLTVEKWRDNGQTQIRPAWLLTLAGQRPVPGLLHWSEREGGTRCREESKDRHS